MYMFYFVVNVHLMRGICIERRILLHRLVLENLNNQNKLWKAITAQPTLPI